jgi:hypothetical protein
LVEETNCGAAKRRTGCNVTLPRAHPQTHGETNRIFYRAGAKGKEQRAKCRAARERRTGSNVTFVKFKVRGPSQHTLDGLSPAVKRVTTFLDKLPIGDLIETNRNLAIELRVSQTWLDHISPDSHFEPYRAKLPRGHVFVWGNKKTIAEFRKRFKPR